MMKHIIFSFSIFATLIFLVILFPSVADSSVHTTSQPTNTGLPNPIGPQTMTFSDLLIQVTQILLGLVSLFGVSMFIYGGVLLLTSGGNPDRLKKAKDTLVWAIFGIAVIIFSWTIVKYILDNF